MKKEIKNSTTLWNIIDFDNMMSSLYTRLYDGNNTNIIITITVGSVRN